MQDYQTHYLETHKSPKMDWKLNYGKLMWNWNLKNEWFMNYDDKSIINEID
jgi:hypothetical protein